MISLSFQNITDEIFALTALRARNSPEAEIPATLTRDQLPALRILVRNSFSQLVAELIPYVADAVTEDSNLPAQQPFNPREPLTLTIDFGSYTASLPSGSLLILRRRLEHIIALMTLASIYGNPHSAEIASLIESVVTLLTLGSPSSVLTVTQYK